MHRNRYSKEFKEQALSKARQRGSRTLESVAKELNIPLGSLKGCLKTSNQKASDSAILTSLPSDTAAQHWSSTQRLQALLESRAKVSVMLTHQVNELIPNSLCAMSRLLGTPQHLEAVSCAPS